MDSIGGVPRARLPLACALGLLGVELAVNPHKRLICEYL